MKSASYFLFHDSFFRNTSRRINLNFIKAIEFLSRYEGKSFLNILWISVAWIRVNDIRNGHNWFDLPMRWDSVDPIDTAIFHRDARIKSTSYGLLDQYLLALFKPCYQALLNLNCTIDLGQFFIEK